jgi:8-oxo-dGTP pyrophosphatase MutT (NUDIX family)
MLPGRARFSRCVTVSIVKRDSEALRPPDPRLLSAGVVLVRPAAAGSRYLVLRAYRNWDFPKGVVEPGENPLAAAVREVREETSLDDLDFRWGHGFRETEPYARGKVARYYLAASPPSGQVRLAPSPELGRPEHHEFRWAMRAEAARLLPPRLQPVLEWAASLVEAETATNEE